MILDKLVVAFSINILKFGHLTFLRHELRTLPTIVIAHTFCASPDTRISYR